MDSCDQSFQVKFHYLGCGLEGSSQSPALVRPTWTGPRIMVIVRRTFLEPNNVYCVVTVVVVPVTA